MKEGIKKLFIIIQLIVLFGLLILLTYTFTKNVAGYDIRKATDYCATKGGVQHYSVLPPERVTCFSGDSEVVNEL